MAERKDDVDNIGRNTDKKGADVRAQNGIGRSSLMVSLLRRCGVSAICKSFGFATSIHAPARKQKRQDAHFRRVSYTHSYEREAQRFLSVRAERHSCTPQSLFQSRACAKDGEQIQTWQLSWGPSYVLTEDVPPTLTPTSVKQNDFSRQEMRDIHEPHSHNFSLTPARDGGQGETGQVSWGPKYVLTEAAKVAAAGGRHVRSVLSLPVQPLQEGSQRR